MIIQLFENQDKTLEAIRKNNDLRRILADQTQEDKKLIHDIGKEIEQNSNFKHKYYK